jgi:hypothetical protein
MEIEMMIRAGIEVSRKVGERLHRGRSGVKSKLRERRAEEEEH